MNLALKDKSILITGASSGIGAAIAKAALEDEAALFLSSRDTSKLNRLFSGTGVSKVMLKDCELTSEKNIIELADAVPALDGLVHAAGMLKLVPAKMLVEKQLRKQFSINLDAAVLLITYLLQKNKIRDGASIVFISSVASTHPFGAGSLYAAAKAALQGYARALAIELAERKIRVNTISPGLVRTPLLDNAGKNYLQEMKRRYPLGIGEAGDISGAALFLLSDQARWITGTDLVADGGFSLT